MNKLTILGLIATISCSVVHAAQPNPAELAAQRLEIDRKNEEVTAHNLTLSVPGGTQLRAGMGTFRIDSGEFPRVLEIETAQISAGTHRVNLEVGAYYNEVHVLTTPTATITRPIVLETHTATLHRNGRTLAADRATLLNDEPEAITCSRAVLYSDGVAVPGNSICLGNGSGGGIRISCNAAGNGLKIEFLDQACPLTD